MRAPLRQTLARLLARRRGQAMLEYSLVSHMLLFGAGGMLVMVFGSDNGLLAGINKFYDSVYFVIQRGAM